jgi:predicted Zn-dependent protease
VLNRIVKYRAAIIFGTIVLILAFMDVRIRTSPKQITNKQVEQIYNNLWKYAGLTGKNKPKLDIIESSQINAFQSSSENKIGIYTGLIKFLNDEDEIAGILAHEIAHYLMEHSKLNPTGNMDYQTVLEGNADKMATYLILRAGYDFCKLQVFWLKLRETNGDFELNTNHPNYSYRAWQYQFPSCGV